MRSLCIKTQSLNSDGPHKNMILLGKNRNKTSITEIGTYDMQVSYHCKVHILVTLKTDFIDFMTMFIQTQTAIPGCYLRYFAACAKQNVTLKFCSAIFSFAGWMKKS